MLGDMAEQGEKKLRQMDRDIRKTLYGKEEIERTPGKPLFEMDASVFGLTFQKIEERQPEPGATWTYEIWEAPTKEKGLIFLRSIASFKIPVHYYVIASTPDGSLGKDCNGMFDETTGQPIT